jgi:Pyridoxine 5'-phosphate oxidase C-terminal dimerisation region
MQGYFELEAEIGKIALRFGVNKVPRPSFWSGFRVVPAEIEFWTEKPFRRHQRILYTHEADRWQMQWLYPLRCAKGARPYVPQSPRLPGWCVAGSILPSNKIGRAIDKERKASTSQSRFVVA